MRDCCEHQLREHMSVNEHLDEHKVLYKWKHHEWLQLSCSHEGTEAQKSGRGLSNVTQQIGHGDRTEYTTHRSAGTHLPMGTLCDVKDSDSKPAGQKQGLGYCDRSQHGPCKEAQIPSAWSYLPFPSSSGGLVPRPPRTSLPDQAPCLC